MSVFLHALAIRNFRGIGPEYQEATGFTDFNFFIGPNNAGKSTILDAIARYLPITQIHLSHSSRSQPIPDIPPLDTHHSRISGEIAVAVGIPTAIALETSYKIRPVGELGSHNTRLIQTTQSLLKTIIEWLAPDGFLWPKNIPPYKDTPKLRFLRDHIEAKSIINENEWKSLWKTLTMQDGGGFQRHWFPETIHKIISAQSLNLPSIKFIPALRRIGSKGEDFGDFSGSGLIDRLAELQNPDHDKREEAALFERINSFLRTVTNHPQARIEVPHDRKHLLVRMDDRVLPLGNLGTGIHQVIMLAAFCTITEQQIVCLEEPELHLHPLLQRRLIDYLRQHTTNQYFIATHSAAFIDTPGASIYRVWQKDGTTRITNATLKRERFNICTDLGYHASDLLQTNAIIWVEGPSDRIYIQHWLKAVAPDLIEGTHYSIMFYGGRLLSHLSAEDDEVSGFIALRQLNRNLAIVIDSDKNDDQTPINNTKQRLIKEFEEHGGIAWVTQGREIENYVLHTLLQEAVQSTHANYVKPAGKSDPFSHALHYKRYPAQNPTGRQETVKDVDKVKVARRVCETSADLGPLDLRERITALADMIYAANTLPKPENNQQQG